MFTGEIQRSRSKTPLVVGGLLALLVVAHVESTAKDGQAAAEFDNAKAELRPGLSGTAELSGDDTTLLSSLLST